MVVWIVWKYQQEIFFHLTFLPTIKWMSTTPNAIKDTHGRIRKKIMIYRHPLQLTTLMAGHQKKPKRHPGNRLDTQDKMQNN